MYVCHRVSYLSGRVPMTMVGIASVSVRVALILSLFAGTLDAKYPANEYEYSIRREWLVQAERNLEKKHNITRTWVCKDDQRMCVCDCH